MEKANSGMQELFLECKELISGMQAVFLECTEHRYFWNAILGLAVIFGIAGFFGVFLNFSTLHYFRNAVIINEIDLAFQK